MLSKETWEEWRWWILSGLALFTIAVVWFVVWCINDTYNKREFLMSGLVEMNYGITPIATTYVPEEDYFKYFSTTEVPENYETMIKFSSTSDKAGFADELAGFSEVWDVTEPNKALYDLADRYYQVYWKSQRVSPIFPLALANVETGGRANHSITWSSLYPSAILPIELMYTADVTTVISDDSYYIKLSKEWSTRDRGALQMSPTYGTKSDYFNSKMSGTEKHKLSDCDTSKYSTWVAGASNESGDRFYVPDVCLRLASANTSAIEQMVTNDYMPASDLQLVCMLGQYHHRSGVWSYKNHDKSCGEWKSCGKAFEHSEKISSEGFVKVLRDYALQHPTEFTITRDKAYELYKNYFGEGFENYTDSKLVGCYPITVLYSYIKMSIMYSGLGG